MTGTEKGLSWVAVIIIVGLLVAWMWVHNQKVPESTPPTYKIGDKASAADLKDFDPTIKTFNSNLGK